MSMVDNEYYKVKQILGHRPSRVELFKNMDMDVYLKLKKNSNGNIFRDYIGYLIKMGELSEDEKISIEGNGHKIIKMLEQTNMSKSYKIPFLLAFYNNGNLKSEIDDEDLFISFKEFYSRRETSADMYADKSTSDFKDWGRSKFIDVARKGPVKAMLKSHKDIFKIDKNKIVAEEFDELKNNKFFIENMKDIIDFRMREYYLLRFESDVDCIFCKIDDFVLENELAFAIFDKFPVTKGHMLFIPKRHVANFFDLTKEEREAIFDLVDEGKKLLDEKYSPDAYNVGVNVGEYSGQSVMHVHIHLMPRYIGDTKYPKGGVRGVIPEKMSY